MFRRRNLLLDVSKKTLKEGHLGFKPAKGDTVTVHCTGMLTSKDRKKFWSTRDTNQPFSFMVDGGQVIKGWDKGLKMMSLNEIAEIEISGGDGYGKQGFPTWGIGPFEVLTFEIELLEIQRVGAKSGM